MTVLYIEDRDMDAKLFSTLLGIAASLLNLSLEMSRARNLEEVPPCPCVDIILLDAQLNGGAEDTFVWVRANAPLVPPIFMLSGHPGHSLDCIKAGAADFMDKGEAVHDAKKLIERMQLAIVRHRSKSPL